MDVRLSPQQLDFVEHLDGDLRRRFLADMASWLADHDRRLGVLPRSGPVPDALVPRALAAVLSRPEWMERVAGVAAK